MRNMEATTVANILVHEFIFCFGVPKYLHTDQGQNFEAKEICSLLDIKKTTWPEMGGHFRFNNLDAT